MEVYKQRQLLIVLCVYTGQMLVGYSFGWIIPAAPKLQDANQTTLDVVVTPGQAAWIGPLLYVGAVIGPHIAGYLANVVGRKPCLQLGGALTLVSFAMVVVARTLNMVYAQRIVQGFGIGIIYVNNLVYIGEIAPTNIRGMLLTGTGLFNALGALIVYSTGPFISFKNTGYIGMAISVIYIFGLFWIPESPVFHILRRNELKAGRTLAYIGRADDIHILKEANHLNDQTEVPKFEWLEIFTVKSNRKAFIIVMLLGIFQQLSGILAILFFASAIFGFAGAVISPNIVIIILGVTRFVSSSLSTIFVDRCGRKVLMLISSGVCAVSLAALGTYFYLDQKDHASTSTIGWLPLTSFMMFLMAYDLGLSIIPNTITGEVYRLNVRSAASAMSITLVWLFSVAVTTTFNYALPTVDSHFVFWFFSSVCVVAFAYAQFCVPETKNKTFLEVEELFSR